MATSVSRIQIGQLWKKDGTGETFLVTRVYSEALSTMATLRKSGAESEALVRVKVERADGRQTLPLHVVTFDPFFRMLRDPFGRQRPRPHIFADRRSLRRILQDRFGDAGWAQRSVRRLQTSQP